MFYVNSFFLFFFSKNQSSNLFNCFIPPGKRSLTKGTYLNNNDCYNFLSMLSSPSYSPCSCKSCTVSAPPYTGIWWLEDSSPAGNMDTLVRAEGSLPDSMTLQFVFHTLTYGRNKSHFLYVFSTLYFFPFYLRFHLKIFPLANFPSNSFFHFSFSPLSILSSLSICFFSFSSSLAALSHTACLFLSRN